MHRRNSSEKRGFKETIAAHEQLSADDFAKLLLEEVDSWTGKDAGSAQADYITLVVVDVEMK
jgi:hypothetical protein